jgi:hypothetical protein
MMKKIMDRLKRVFGGVKVDKWAEEQIREMAKLGGKLVL